MQLLYGEPAGKVITRSPGIVHIQATLEWSCPEEVPQAPILPAIPPSETTKLCVNERRDPGSVGRTVNAELRAFTEAELAGMLDSVLRSLTAAATLGEAMLESGVVRTARPSSTEARVLEELASGLWNAGFPVSFGRSWEPACGGKLSVGVSGLEGELHAFFGEHPFWTISDRAL